MVLVSEIVSALKITDSLTVGEILHAKGLYSTIPSGQVNGQKKLNNLVALGQLTRGDGYYRVLDCKSEYEDHARLLTKALAEVLKLSTVKPVIYRELTIDTIGLRPDAIILLTRDGKGLCLVLEILINETESYFNQKVNAWHHWEGSLAYLSNLFGYAIPHFEIIPIADIAGFNSYLQEVLQ
jgi:hypothetical protein